MRCCHYHIFCCIYPSISFVILLLSCFFLKMLVTLLKKTLDLDNFSIQPLRVATSNNEWRRMNWKCQSKGGVKSIITRETELYLSQMQLHNAHTFEFKTEPGSYFLECFLNIKLPMWTLGFTVRELDEDCKLALW